MLKSCHQILIMEEEFIEKKNLRNPTFWTEKLSKNVNKYKLLILTNFCNCHFFLENAWKLFKNK